MRKTLLITFVCAVALSTVQAQNAPSKPKAPSKKELKQAEKQKEDSIANAKRLAAENKRRPAKPTAAGSRIKNNAPIATPAKAIPDNLERVPNSALKGSANKWKNVADEAFKEGRYFKAYGYYERAYNRQAEGELRMQLRVRLGETQSKLNNPVDARVFFDRAWQHGYRQAAFLYDYADILLKTAAYGKADTIYRMILKMDTSNVFVKNRILSCELGRQYSDTAAIIQRDEIWRQKRISTPFSEYGLGIMNGRLIYSSSKRTSPRLTDYRTGHGFSHLYWATYQPDSAQFTNPSAMGFNLWGDHINDGVFSYDPVHKQGYFQRCNDGNCGIYVSNFEDNEWQLPVPFEINTITDMVGHPAISPDGNRLLFVTRAPGGEGGGDIWMTTRAAQTPTTSTRRSSSTANKTIKVDKSKSTSRKATAQTVKNNAAPTPRRNTRSKLSNTAWSAPINLGPTVNSIGDELFPSWVNDRAFTFASNGKVGYGGLDLYLAIIDSSDQFSVVKHLEAPINSSFDDYTVVASSDMDRAYFTSNRFLGTGKTDDIFSFPKRAGLVEFNFSILDVKTQKELADVEIQICANDSCETIRTDNVGKANYLMPKRANTYDIHFAKQDYYKGSYQAILNEAMDIFPVRNTENIVATMHPDTSNKLPPVPPDTVPVEWTLIAQAEGGDSVSLTIAGVLDSNSLLLSPESCIGALKVTFFNIDSNLYCLDDVLSLSEQRQWTDTNLRRLGIPDSCLRYYAEELALSQKFINSNDSTRQIKGEITYSVWQRDTLIEYSKPFETNLPARSQKAPEVKDTIAQDTIITDTLPIVQWYPTVYQPNDSSLAQLILTAKIKDAWKMVGIRDFQSQLKPTRIQIESSPLYGLEGEWIENAPAIQTFDGVHNTLTDLYEGRAEFVRNIKVLSSTDVQIKALLSYTLVRDTTYRHYDSVEVLFYLKGQVPDTIDDSGAMLAAAGLSDDDDWLNGLNESDESKQLSEDFDLRMRAKTSGVQDLSDCMRPGMSPQEIIDCLNQTKKEDEVVDRRTVDEYRDRINDPNRRTRLEKLPADARCEECEKQAKKHPVKDEFYVGSGDDKKVLKLTDNAGNTTYVDLAPNTNYNIKVTNLSTGGGGDGELPSYLNKSDLVKTVSTKDYIIYECMPKLAEIGDESYVNNIYYDFDKKDIIKDGHRELDRLVVIALKNPSMTFEVVAHADERGSEEYNLSLTEGRLGTITQYLNKKGLDMSRILGRAVGEAEPLLKGAQTDEEHALNRRTTIRLINPEAANELQKVAYEIPEDSPIKMKGLHFRVQIGAYRVAPEYPMFFFKDVLSKIPESKLTYFFDKDGLYKYNIGVYQDLDKARAFNRKVLDSGKECYVVAYLDGQRITISEAQAIIEHQKKTGK